MAARVEAIGLSLGTVLMLASACSSTSTRRQTDPNDDVIGSGARDTTGSRPSGNVAAPGATATGGVSPTGVGGKPSRDPDDSPGWAGDGTAGAWTYGGAPDAAAGGAPGSVSVDIIIPSAALLLSERSGTAEVEVALSAQPTSNVMLTLESAAPAHAKIEPAALVFTPQNWEPQSVTVRGVDDFIADGDHPLLVVTAPLKSNDARYDGLDPDDIAVIVLDETDPGVVVSHGPLSTTESGGTATFGIFLNSKPTASVTFPLSSSDPGEGTVPSSVTIAPQDWLKPHLVTVTGYNDVDSDGNQPYEIVIGAAQSEDPHYAGIVPPAVPVMNVDDE